MGVVHVSIMHIYSYEIKPMWVELKVRLWVSGVKAEVIGVYS